MARKDRRRKATVDARLKARKIILLGDLNYRLVNSCDKTRELLEENEWEALLEKDQLRIEQRAGHVLRGWKEGKISFPPTYKYLPNSDCYAFSTAKHGDKPRTPAWCDRILWRGDGMKQISYSRYESQFSDHRPVHSLFSIKIDDYCDPLRPNTATAADSYSISSASSRVEAEEMLVITRAQSCLSATRF
ncbi:uncharacterized protein A4U43_C02F1830 [Asparagus officinalis]|uniref:Inositol polyphosphate-related phosphatase domain-containing protein n=1 Tax=Asparagus officinalis TaxID=4686 RepID=A0A5P1FF19_ASPOF|nr:uncharacterized protein A4U43_C02F1830 [Asparagus officinalis]